jgi:hypothetical protein
MTITHSYYTSAIWIHYVKIKQYWIVLWISQFPSRIVNVDWSLEWIGVWSGLDCNKKYWIGHSTD